MRSMTLYFIKEVYVIFIDDIIYKYIFFVRNVYLRPSFLNWVVFLLLGCKSSLYVVDTRAYQLYDLQMFSHSVGYLLTIMTVFFIYKTHF